MPLSPRTLRPANTFTPRSISGLALWLDAADSSSLYTTDAGPVVPVNDPRDISGCVLWLDGADASTVTASGGNVSEWRDKTSTGSKWAPVAGDSGPATATQTINGRNVIVFNGTNTSLSANITPLSTSLPLTFFLVQRIAVATNSGMSYAVDNGSFFISQTTSDGRLRVHMAGSDFLFEVSGNRVGVNDIISLTVPAGTGTSGSLHRNGAAITPDAATIKPTLAGTHYIGRRSGGIYLNGWIAEIVAYNTALSPTDRARVEAYLAAKWGITGVHAQATAASDPVGYWRDRSGNGRHATQSTAGNRPLVGSVASGRGLVFDSNDSLLSLASIADIVGSPASSPATTIAFIALNSSGVAGFTVGSDNAANGRLLVSNSFDAAGGSFFDVAGASASGRLSYTLQASSQTAAGVYVVQRNGASMTVRRNGATIATKSDASQTFSATTARLSIGQAIGLTGFSGTCGSLLCYPSAISTAERQRLERYLAARWGITLAPQVSNADAQDWINRVYANGSTVSATTAAAVNTFCDAINNAGIRDRFYRMNLFAGGAGSSDTTRLNAALVPLYRGPSLGGTQYGGTTDTNAGGAAAFITTDFTELGSGGGLQGNGTKYLNTGLAHNTLPQDDSHIACYEIARASATFRVSVGCRASSTTGNLILGTWASTANYSALAFQSGSVLNIASSAGGFYLCSVNGSADTAFYRNGGGKVTSASTTRTPSSQNVFVFALNDAGNVSVPTDARLGGYSLGLRLNDAETAEFNTAMQAFQTALGRNV